MLNIYQHIIFLTSAAFDEEGMMEMEDRARLTTVASMVHEGDIVAHDTLFVADGSLASLETVYHMSNLLYYWKEKTRQISLGFDFWSRPKVTDILHDISRKKAFDEDLWIFVGNTQYVLRVMAVLFPERHDMYGISGNLPSAVPIGVTVASKGELFETKEYEEINPNMLN